MPQTTKEPRLRTQRMESLLQELLGPVVSEYTSEQKALVTVSKVEVSGDMRHAKVWLSILGGDDDTILNVLKKNIYDIQGEIHRKVSMKIVPRIQFFLDTSPRFAQHISEILDNID